MTRLQISHQRVPRRTKAKPASERLPNRDCLIVQRFDGDPQTQTTGLGDGRTRRRRRRRVADDDVARGTIGGAASSDGDGRAVVVAIVGRDDVGGAVGAAIVGVERVGVGVPRGCPTPRSEPSFLVIGPRRRQLPLPAPGVGGLGPTDPYYHYATLSHGEKVEVESVAGTRGRSAKRAEGRDATWGRPARATIAASRSTSDRECDGEATAQA